MLKYLHTLSAIVFYVLAGSFFAAYLLMQNGIMSGAATAWLSMGDLPLALSGLLYGGLSIYHSVHSEKSVGRGLLLMIGLPLLILFIVVAIMNFLPRA